MDIEIREFITYLHNRKRTSHNTEVSYQRDLKKMAVYFADRGIYDIRDVGELELEGYLYSGHRHDTSAGFLPDLSGLPGIGADSGGTGEIICRPGTPGAE